MNLLSLRPLCLLFFCFSITFFQSVTAQDIEFQIKGAVLGKSLNHYKEQYKSESTQVLFGETIKVNFPNSTLTIIAKKEETAKKMWLQLDLSISNKNALLYYSSELKQQYGEPLKGEELTRWITALNKDTDYLESERIYNAWTKGNQHLYIYQGKYRWRINLIEREVNIQQSK